MFKGSIVAIITPFHEDGSVDYTSLNKLLNWHIENGTSGIVILGTTGEAATLTKEEKLKVFKTTVETVNKRIPVIAGTGSNNTFETISFSQEVEALGVDALLIVTPYYNKANTEGFIQHFTQIADAVDTPIILYNVPSRTGCNLPIDALKELMNHKNIVGIKEASGDISYTAKVASTVPYDFLLFSGNDDQVLPVLSLGGVGVISVAANIIPSEFSKMVELYLNGYHQEALDIQLKYLNCINDLFLETNPIPVKYVVHKMHDIQLTYRLPLCKPSQSVMDQLDYMIERYRL